jgi:GT2 family glycosyltransferase
VIIPTKNRLEMLEKCLPPLLEDTDYPDFEVILVDNDSEEAVQDYYRRLQSEYAPERLRVVDYPGQFNYNTANNLGASQARGELLLFLNNDIQALDSGWLKEMSRWAERPEIGAVGAKLLYPQGTIQHAGVVMGMGAYAGHVFFQAPAEANGPFGSVDWYRDYNAVTAACLMTRRQVFEETGGFDESYQLAMSDVELCLRIRRAGYRIMYTPYARLIHYEGSTRSGHIPALDLTLAYLHMREYVQDGDPYYNPNLSYAVPIPTLKPNAELPRLERFERFYRAYAQTGVPASPAE